MYKMKSLQEILESVNELRMEGDKLHVSDKLKEDINTLIKELKRSNPLFKKDSDEHVYQQIVNLIMKRWELKNIWGL